MHVLAKDAIDISNHMEDMEKEGNHWVVLNTNKDDLEKAGLHFFRKFKEAEFFQQELGDMPYSYGIVSLKHFNNLLINEIQSNTDEKEPFKIEILAIDLGSIYPENFQDKAQLDIENLLERINPYGFGEELGIELSLHIGWWKDPFTVRQNQFFGEDKMTFTLHFAKVDDNDHAFTGYGAVLIKPLVLHHQIINGINSEVLEKEMGLVDWDHDLADNIFREIKKNLGSYNSKDAGVDLIIHELKMLKESDEAGKELAGLLQYKYWQGTFSEPSVDGLQDLQNKYAKSIFIPAENNLPLKTLHAYNLLSGRSVALPVSADAEGNTNRLIWFFAQGDEQGAQKLKPFAGFGRADFENELTVYPFQEISDPERRNKIAVSILDGKPAEVSYKFPDGPAPVFVWMDLNHHRLLFNIPGSDFFIHQSKGLGFTGDLKKTHADLFTNKNLSVMNTENFAFLKDAMKYLGFSEKLNLEAQLEGQIRQGAKEFNLSAKPEFKEEKSQATQSLDINLSFRKSDQLDMYFFNKYTASLKDEENMGKEKSQTFYINKGAGVTVKEAFNLLQGRAVNKVLTSAEGQKYNAWIQLNFGEKDQWGNFKMKQYREQYGYDLQKTLEKYPIQELSDPEKKSRLIKSLEKGNSQLVTFEKSNKTEQLYIEANPQYKTLNIYHGHDRVQQQAEGKSEVKSTSKQQNQESGEGKGEDEGKKKGKKTNKSDSDEPGEQVKSRSKGR